MPVDLFASPLQAPDAATRDRIINAVAAVAGYQPTIPDPANPGQTIPNPSTKRAFVKDHLRAYLRQTVIGYERATAQLPAPPDLA